MRNHVDRWDVARSAAALMTIVLPATTAAASAPHEIASAFVVSKSQNRNQVHYAVRVDDTCQPVTAAPVHPYWQMLEKGQGVTEPLLDREQRAYGIERQQVQGKAIHVVLHALPSRPVEIETWRGPDGSCLSAAFTTIGGARARLFDVHLQVNWLNVGVDYILLTGWRDDGSVVRERVQP